MSQNTLLSSEENNESKMIKPSANIENELSQSALDSLKKLVSKYEKMARMNEGLKSEFAAIAVDPDAKSKLFSWGNINNSQLTEFTTVLTSALGCSFSALAFTDLMQDKLKVENFYLAFIFSFIFATLVIYFLTKTVGNAVGADEVIRRIEEEKVLQKDEIKYEDEIIRFEVLTPLFAEKQRYETRRLWAMIFAGVAAFIEAAAFFLIFTKGLVSPDIFKYIGILIASLISFPIGFLKGHDRGVKYDAKTTFFHFSKTFEEKAKQLREVVDKISMDVEDDLTAFVRQEVLKRQDFLQNELEKQKEEIESLNEQLENKTMEIKDVNQLQQKSLMEVEFLKSQINESDTNLKQKMRELENQEKLSTAAQERVNTIEKRINRILPLANSAGNESKELEKFLKELQPSFNSQSTSLGSESNTSQTQSPIEDLLLAAIKQAGLPEPQLQFDLREGDFYTRPDFAYPDKKIAIYCDGKVYHSPGSNSGNWERDLNQNNQLQLMGWLPLRFSGSQIYKDSSRCVAYIQHALASRPNGTIRA